jgi:hypothetical protein
MFRFIKLAVICSICVGAAPAFAQIGVFPGVTPPLSSFQAYGAPPPPTVFSPNLNGPVASGPRIITTPRRGRVVVVPPSASNSFSDRVQSCIAGGIAAGLGPNGGSRFVNRCAN